MKRHSFLFLSVFVVVFTLSIIKILFDMKRFFAIALFSVCTAFLLNAQITRYAIVVIEPDSETPVIREYHAIPEKAGNGKDYYRIYDDSYLFGKESYNPVKLQYGYRLADRQIYIYDFELEKETLAFDFNLSKGDHFTTYNGMEWIVLSAKDTLVNVSYMGKGERTSRRLLSVQTLDGKIADEWLEDFGSFGNQFMINSLTNQKYSQTLWAEYGYGEYLTREISSDPIYTHDSEWLEGNNGENIDAPYTKCSFENGQLVFENVQWMWEHRDYVCFYRDGDEILVLYQWELEPHVDSGTSVLMRDVVTIVGLPTPSSGQYTIHVKENDYTANVDNVAPDAKTAGIIFDLQGRRLNAVPQKGLYIGGGKKCEIKP
jgi:hypothetical protein